MTPYGWWYSDTSSYHHVSDKANFGDTSRLWKEVKRNNQEIGTSRKLAAFRVWHYIEGRYRVWHHMEGRYIEFGIIWKGGISSLALYRRAVYRVWHYIERRYISKFDTYLGHHPRTVSPYSILCTLGVQPLDRVSGLYRYPPIHSLTTRVNISTHRWKSWSGSHSGRCRKVVSPLVMWPPDHVTSL